MGYADAIEQQARLLDFWTSPTGIAQCKMAFRDVPPGRFENWQAIQYDVTRALRTEDVYYVAPPICDLVAHSGTTLPETALEMDDAPSHEGVILFDRPLAWPALAQSYDDYDQHGLALMTWRSVWLVEGPTRMHGASVDAHNALALTAYSTDRSMHRMALAMISPWRHGERWSQIRGDDPNVCPEAARYLLAFFRFIRQRVLTTSSRPVANRSVRRRIARAFEHIPEVKVVQLRARDYQQRDESQPRDWEYTCQWMVRGHWHQYHTKEGLQPRWVMPYVKGPSDKPLRVAEKVAYEVVR